METIKQKTKNAFDILKADFGYKNPMQAPKIEKVIVSSGVGSLKDKKKLDVVEDRLAKITGQKPVRKGAKISIATFKVREGDILGMQVTLRGQKMYDFLDRLVNIALPRTKDFRGISGTGVDEMGNYTLGIRDQLIFPEIDYARVEKLKGMNITIVTTAKDDNQARALLRHFGMPFRQDA